MMTDVNGWLLTLTGVLAGALVTVILIDIRNKIRRRTTQLKTLNKALDSYNWAIEKLDKDPAISDELQRYIEFVDEVVLDKKFVSYLIETLESNKSHRKSGLISEYVQDLEKIRPDLADAFDTMTSSMVVVMILKWPDIAFRFEKIISRALSDSRSRYEVSGTVLARLREARPEPNLVKAT